MTRAARNTADGLGFGNDVGALSTIGRWYLANQGGGTALTAAALTADTLLAVPFMSPWRGGRVDRLGVEVTVGSAGDLRLGIYAPTSLIDLYPGARVVDGGVVDTTAVGVKTVTIATNLQPGRMYYAVLLPEVTPTITMLDPAAFAPLLGVDVGAAFGELDGHIAVGQAFGALPATFPALGAATRTDTPAIALRFGA